MSKLIEYIENMKEYISREGGITETEIIRYVYIDLGKRFSFNSSFMPFGNSKKNQNLYNYHSRNLIDLEECMETNIVICKSVAYILEYILKKFGVNIRTVIDSNDYRKCPHVYNIITSKEGKTYMVDLQEDMYNIQSHSFTKNFGLSVDDRETYVISRFEQEQMDRKSGYIDDKNYYSDDYLYLLKYDADFIENFDEKVKFILENIDIYDNPNMGYTDRQWHHKTVLEQFFSKKEFDYQTNTGKIRMIDCYKVINNKIHYVNCISVQTKNGTEVYIYNKKKYRYCKMDLIDFAKAVQNGLVIHNCNVPGLNKVLKQLKEEKHER